MNGKAASTPTEALNATREAGYVVEKLTPTTSKYNIVWNQEKNQFALLDENNKTVFGEVSKTTYKNWKFASSYNNKEEYSVYLNNDFEGTLPDSISTGIDVGENENVNVSYTKSATAKDNVIIRTNGGSLTIDADTDSISHYGESKNVTINAVAPHSYHENGTIVGNLEVLKGRVELVSTANVNTIVVKSTTENDVKIDLEGGAKVGTVAPTTEAAKKDITSSSTIPADSKVTEIVDTKNVSLFDGGLGTKNSPYLVANETQLNNVSTLSLTETARYFKQINDIKIQNTIENNAGYYDGNNNKISYFTNEQDFDYVFHYAKGYVEIKNLTIEMGNVGVSLLNLADWGTGYGATFENIIFNSTSTLTKVNSANFGFVVMNALFTKGDSNPVYNFKNITNNVNLQNEGTCTGFIVGSGPCFITKTTLNFENCVNNGSIEGTTSVGYLYGNAAYLKESSGNIVINVENCKNNSVLSSTSDNAKVEFAPKLDDINSKYQLEVGGTFLATNYLKDKDIIINQSGNVFSINTNDNNVSYKLAFEVSATYWKQDYTSWTEKDIELIANKGSNYGEYDKVWNVSNGKKFFIDLIIDSSATGSLNKIVKAFDKITAEKNGIVVSKFNGEFEVVEKDGVTYIVLNTTPYTYIDCSVSLKVYTYDASGTLIGIKNIK